MNEYGKSCRDVFIVDLSLMLTVIILFPYIESTGFDYAVTSELIQSVEFSEHVYWFVVIGFVLGMCYLLGCFVGNILTYAVYFVQRVWYLHKLRKPERIYTGDPL